MRLDHPLLGRDSRLTAIGLGYCALVVVGAIVGAVLAAGAVDAVPGRFLEAIDGFLGGLILAAVISATAAPLAYALANGGPATATLVAIAPSAAIPLVTGRVWLTNDVVMALVAAAVAATVAVVVGAWSGRTVRREPRPGDLDGLLVASAVTVVATAAVLRFDRGGPSWLVETVDPAPWTIALGMVGCTALWLWWAPSLVDALDDQSAAR